MKGFKYLFLIIIVGMLLDCAIYQGPCAYDLLENGWSLTTSQPKGLVDEYNINNHWFSNESGDFFSCPELIRKNVCVGVYQIFTKLENGGFEEKHIACVE